MKHCCQIFTVTLLSCLLAFGARAQNPVKGTVRAADSVLAGATITVKGTQVSTQTDAAGHFTINASPGAVLVISYIGYADKEVPVKGGGPVAVQLQSSNNSMNDVIVVGYGTQRKSDITGSVSSVRLADVAKTPANRADDALQGRVAGVVIQHNDASPAAAVTIRIRGSNSIQGANDPLIVIDGLQGGNLATLSPQDIESMEVLKDASATAIYGSRGSNGVILVTTKHGRVAKPTVSLDGMYGNAWVRRTIPLMNSYQYATTVNQNRQEFSLPTVFSANQLDSFQNGEGTNWQNAIFRHGYSQNYILGISGGNENTTYYVSGNVLDTKGVILNSGYQRYSFRGNLTTHVGGKLTFGVSSFMSKELDHPTALNTLNGQGNGSPVISALLFAPTKTIFDANGNYTLPSGNYGPPTNYNPVALAVTPVRNWYTNTTNILAYVEYAILPGLKLNISGGYSLTEANDNDYFNALPTGLTGTETADISEHHLYTYQNTNQLTYEKHIKDHYLKLTGVVEQQYQKYDSVFAGSVGFVTNSVSYNDLGLGNSPQLPASTAYNRSLMSYMGRINYGYKDLYLLTLTERFDASSVFGANNKWGSFPSAAVGWNLGNEQFMQAARSTLTNAKIRASYGLVGNQAIAPYQSLAALNTGQPYPTNGSTLAPGVGVGNFANPNLKWESTAQLDLGADLDFWNGRLDVTADYYNKKTSNLLLSVPTPEDQGGNGTLLENVGKVQNRGVELYIGGRIIQSRSFVWQTGVTVALNRNKVLSLANGDTAITLGGPGLPNFGNTIWLQDGQPMGLFKGYIYQGVWSTAEAAQAAAYGVIPGAPKYKDVNGDGKIDQNDITNMGNAQPKYSFGWTNTFTYANFDLNIFIQGVQGVHTYNISRVRIETTSSDADATSVKVLDRWTPEHQNTDVPSFTGSEDYENLQSSRWMENSSYVRLKNIALGYTIPMHNAGKVKISALRVYVTGTNLITWTKYSGYDPEANAASSLTPGGSANGADAYSGVDFSTFPSQKTITAGVSVKF